MKIDIQTTEFGPYDPVRVGNVYPVKGGRGLKQGHLQVVIAITESREYHGQSALLLVTTKDGKPVGVNSYGLSYVEELCPVAFVEGLDNLTLVMRSL